MGRRRTIDRDQLLDAAEAVIAREGAAGLTIDAVAKEMGITKGGVQYCFGTKDALIDAIFERWGKAYDSLFEAVAGKQPTPLTRVRAHAEATQRSDELSSSKAAALMAALIQTPEHLEGSNQWYRSRLEGLDLSAPEGRRARLAFLAVEGAFMLRYFRLMDIGQEEWDSMLDDVRALLLNPEAIAEHLPARSLPWVLGVSFGLALAFGLAGLLALLVTLMLFAWLRSRFLARLGGTTGDTAGALVELTECAVLVALAL